MDLYSRTQEYGCGSCFGESDLMSAQTLAGSGSAWYKQTAKAMDSLTQGLSKSGRNLTTKKQRKELAEIGIDALKQKTNPTGAAIEQFDDLYLTGKGNCGEMMMAPTVKKALAGKGAKKALEKIGAGAKKVAKKAKPNKKTQKKMAKGAVGGAIAGGITGAAAGGPAGAAAGVAAGAVGGATGAYVEGQM
jgi:hypothetical protein